MTHFPNHVFSRFGHVLEDAAPGLAEIAPLYGYLPEEGPNIGGVLMLAELGDPEAIAELEAFEAEEAGEPLLAHAQDYLEHHPDYPEFAAHARAEPNDPHGRPLVSAPLPHAALPYLVHHTGCGLIDHPSWHAAGWDDRSRGDWRHRDWQGGPPPPPHHHHFSLKHLLNPLNPFKALVDTVAGRGGRGGFGGGGFGGHRGFRAHGYWPPPPPPPPPDDYDDEPPPPPPPPDDGSGDTASGRFGYGGGRGFGRRGFGQGFGRRGFGRWPGYYPPPPPPYYPPPPQDIEPPPPDDGEAATTSGRLYPWGSYEPYGPYWQGGGPAEILAHQATMEAMPGPAEGEPEPWQHRYVRGGRYFAVPGV